MSISQPINQLHQRRSEQSFLEDGLSEEGNFTLSERRFLKDGLQFLIRSMHFSLSQILRFDVDSVTSQGKKGMAAIMRQLKADIDYFSRSSLKVEISEKKTKSDHIDEILRAKKFTREINEQISDLRSRLSISTRRRDYLIKSNLRLKKKIRSLKMELEHANQSIEEVPNRIADKIIKRFNTQNFEIQKIQEEGEDEVKPLRDLGPAALAASERPDNPIESLTKKIDQSITNAENYSHINSKLNKILKEICQKMKENTQKMVNNSEKLTFEMKHFFDHLSDPPALNPIEGDLRSPCCQQLDVLPAPRDSIECMELKINMSTDDITSAEIGGHVTHCTYRCAYKDDNSYLIADNLKGMVLVDQGDILYRKAFSQQFLIEDITYMPLVDYYLISINSKLYRKNIDENHPCPEI